MPASPIVTVTINEEKLKACCVEMGIVTIPHVRVITNSTQEQFYGHYFPASNTINLYAHLREQESGRLLFVQTQLTRTLLHELRHRYQDEKYGPTWYAGHTVFAERDAEHFADTNVHLYRGIIRVGRRYPSSGLSKIEARVRTTRRVG